MTHFFQPLYITTAESCPHQMTEGPSVASFGCEIAPLAQEKKIVCVVQLPPEDRDVCKLCAQILF